MALHISPVLVAIFVGEKHMKKEVPENFGSGSVNSNGECAGFGVKYFWVPSQFYHFPPYLISLGPSSLIYNLPRLMYKADYFAESNRNPTQMSFNRKRIY